MDSISTIAVPVLGMHRSGTSMVSRMLEAGGISFGASKNLAGPGFDNEHGYWENLEIRKINEELLQHLGGDWRCPPALPACGFFGTEYDGFRERAEAALNLLRHSAACWSMKDPRMSLLLPFWQPLLPRPMRAVLCLRHPSAVAESLRKRNNISPELAGFLWHEYMASATLALAESEVLVVGYEKILADPEKESRRLAQFFASFGVALKEDAMVAAVNPELNHSSQSQAGHPTLLAGGPELLEHLLACANDQGQRNSLLPALPPRDPGFFALMQELSLLAFTLDEKESACQDRIQETVDARLALNLSLEEGQEQERRRLLLEQELETERTRMDNLLGRLEVRMGSALRRLLRR